MRGTFLADLTVAEAKALMRPVVGQGGFQSLLRQLQKGFDRRTRTVSIDGELIERINRYANDYGQGGFEDRLDGVRRGLPRLFT